MAMKAAHAEDNADKNITGSTRQHIVSRLHKAVQTAKQVIDLLSDTAASGAKDTDVLEAKAYRYALAGAEEFEKQAEGVKSKDASTQRWNTCLSNFAAARIIYSSLLKVTKQDLFKEVLAGTTDPSIRYAAYQSRIPRTVGVPAIARKFFPKDAPELAKAVQKLDPAALDEEDEASSRKFQVCSALFDSKPDPLQTLKSLGEAEQQTLLTLPLDRLSCLSMPPLLCWMNPWGALVPPKIVPMRTMMF
jgi:signal recognition particle subunit SRP68